MTNSSHYPKITLVTPSYNQGQYMEETILSVLSQGYPNLEYIIIDGGSTDNSVGIIKKYEDQISYWVSEKDNGQSTAINKGWRLSTGDIISWLNADDFHKPDTLFQVATVFTQNPNIIVVCGAGETCSHDGKGVISSKNSASLNPYDMIKACGGVPLQPSVFMKRQVLTDVGYLNEDLHFVMDWEYWIRVGLNYRPSQITTINQTLAINREWPGTKTNAGWQSICNEHRSVLSSLRTLRPYDQKLQQIMPEAYLSSWLKECDLATKNGAHCLAFQALLKALNSTHNLRAIKDEIILFIKTLHSIIEISK